MTVTTNALTAEAARRQAEANRRRGVFGLPYVPGVTAPQNPIDGAKAIVKGGKAVVGGAGKVVDVAQGAASAVAGLDDLAMALGRQDTWIRAGKVVAGVIIVGVAVSRLAAPVAAPVAAAVSPIGKAAKVAGKAAGAVRKVK